MKKDFLKLLDYSGDEINAVVDLAAKLKSDRKNGCEGKPLKDKTLGMIFTKSSTRTRVSFEAGIYQLGGIGFFLSSRDIQLGRGEPIEDTAKILSRYLDGILIRTFAQKDVEDLAKYSAVPVINGLTDFCHPCQVIADFLTIRENYGKLDGLKMTFVGDGNNMANSLIVGGLKTGMSVSIACPDAYRPSPEILKFAKAYGDKFSCSSDIKAEAKDADVLYTDVWASMGMEGEAEKRKLDFKAFCIDEALCAYAGKPIVLHCLPAHRGEEITAGVIDAHPEIFDEAENRLHAHKAIMVALMA